MDELQLRGLLLLHGGQELLEVFALLRDVRVLQALLLAAVAAEQLGPLLSVQRRDVLHLPTDAHEIHIRATNDRSGWRVLWGERLCVTLTLWSATSVWILSSVSFLSSWQLFSL